MDIGRHYELTSETIEFNGHILHRIICTENFRNVRKGTLGGFIESYENLYDEAWVGDEAKVYDGAIVNDYALVIGHACVSHRVCISNRAVVEDSASVSGNGVVIGGYARISDFATVTSGRCTMIINGSAKISGDAIIESNLDYIVFKNWWSSGRYFTL